MTLIEFMNMHPFITLVLGVLALLLVLGIIHYITALANRVIRLINMLKNGYPPPHCDGDGDQIEAESEYDSKTSED